jgi:hypothetical protein
MAHWRYATEHQECRLIGINRKGRPTVKLTQLTLLFENVNSCERRRIGFSDVDAPQLSMLLTLAARAFVGMHSPQLLAASQPRPEVNLL